MVIHVSRDGWDARDPQCSITPLNRDRVTLFIVHYSGEIRDQSVRSIQNFCMDSKGHCDIDYNRIVRGEHDYMGRGWGTGGHTKDHNSISYGVCMIGLDGDMTADDQRTIRAIYDEVCATLGRQLTKTTHRNVLGAGYTSCPGNELDAWVDAGMPLPEEGMGELYTDSRWGNYPDNVKRAPDQHIIDTAKAVLFGDMIDITLPDGTVISDPWVVTAYKNIMEAIGNVLIPPPAQVDQAALNEAVKQALQDPEVVEIIATAVNVDAAERLRTR